KEVRDYASGKIANSIHTFKKQDREEAIDSVKEEVFEIFLEKYPENESDIDAVLTDIIRKEIREMIIEKNIRPDDRKPEEIRPISCDVNILPRAHGSGLFTRGQTQAL